MSLQKINKNSGVLGKEPLPSQLALGEIGVNWNAADPFLSIKDGSGNIRRVSSDQAPQIAALNERINAFRNAATFFVSKAAGASDSNNGTSPGEALLTLYAAVQKANAYVAANPGACCLIALAPGVYIESFLPLRVRRNICIAGVGILRTTTIKPASGQEMNGFFKVDSGFMAWGITFAGHQANSATGEQSWAISFDEQANNTALGASGLGAFITVSPYVQNCTSLTAEDDAGVAPSTSVGDTGGGILVDGNACAPNSPIRSMVVDSYTQVNLGGPGCLVRNDGYAQLVSFFGTFCTYHVRTETGGQVNLSGGTTDFGTYGLMADGFSPQAIFTGQARAAAYGAVTKLVTATVDPSTDTFTSVAHAWVVGDRLEASVSGGDLPGGMALSTTYYVIAAGLGADTFRLSLTAGGSAINVTSAGTGTLSLTRRGALSLDVISLSANRLGPVSRPNPGQLFFPRVNYPSAGTPGSAGNAVTISSVSGAQFTVTLGTSSFAHQYAGGGTVTVAGVGTFNITTAVYTHATGVTTLTASGYVPLAGQSITLSGLAFICPTNSAYVVSSSVPIDASGNTVSYGAANQAGYRVDFFSSTNQGLRYSVSAGQVIDFRLRSQISAPGHTFEYVGSGTNYDALPWRGGIPVRANERVESNNGRVFSSNTNELGDFKVGDAFSVDGTTGAVTINTNQFNLSGLNFIGPFSRNGGLSTVGVQLQEISNNTSLIASTGTPDGNTVPTQYAVKEFTGSRYITGVTATAGQPVTITGSAVADGNGNWTFARNISLSLNVASGLAQLDGTGKIPSSILPSYVDDVLEYANLAAFPATGETGKIYVALDNGKTYRWSGSVYAEISPSPGSTDAVAEGSVNLYFTQARSRQSISATGLIGYDPNTGVITYTGAAPLTSGVTSFSGGTTGLTPSTASTGVVTLAGTLAVANGGTGVTSSTGSGSVVLSTSPTLVTPVLGTPTSGNLSNCTGYTFANIASKPTTLAGYGITDGLGAASNNAFTGANTFTNTTGQLFRQAATQDAILLRGRAGGTSSFSVEIVPTTLTASRALTAPNVSGTIVTTGDTATVTNTMLAGSITDSNLSTITTAGKVSGTAITSGNIATSGNITTTGVMAVGQVSAAANTDLDVNGTYAQVPVAVAALNIDCATGNFFTKTINGASTFTVSNVPSARAYCFTLELTHTSGAVTWFTGVEWPGGTAPSFTAGKTHLFTFVTDDGGTRWRGSSQVNYNN